MMTLFQAMGLVRVEGGLFRLTGLAREHLVRSSPWFIGPYYASLKNRPVCLDLLLVLRSGRPANWGSYRDGKDWARAMEDTEFAQEFTAAMDCRGAFLGKKMGDTLDLTDAHLSKNLRVLSDAGFVAVRKERSPDRADARRLTWITLTPEGRRAVEAHLAALAQIAEGRTS